MDCRGLVAVSGSNCGTLKTAETDPPGSCLRNDSLEATKTLPEPFHPIANTVFKLSVAGIGAVVVLVLGIGYLVVRSDYEMRQQNPREQPLQFSHAHHVGGLGLDCRFCHVSVEESSFADIPPTSTCMHCHSQFWTTSPELNPVRESYRTGKSIQWTRIYELPDYVYFNHSIHIHNGFGCSTCHGRVDLMPLTWQTVPLTMSWCLNCHRNPERYVRPKAEVFNMSYSPPADQLTLGKHLVKEYGIASLTSCSICHR